jgi:hypothetical protein
MAVAWVVMNLDLFVYIQNLLRRVWSRMVNAEVGRMNTRVWDAMSISDSLKMMNNICFHHPVDGRSGRCPFVVRSSHFHKVLHEFTDLKDAVSASQILVQHIIHTYLIVIDSNNLGMTSSSKIE